MQYMESAKILIVDDNEELQKLVTTVLQKDGFYTIRTAGNCEEGRKLFIEEKPDFVILDIMLPDGDGFSLITYFRSLATTPVLFLSAKDEDKDRLQGLGLGADDYLTKPFLPEELVLRIRSILRRTYHIEETTERDTNMLWLGTRKIDFNSATVSFGENVMELTAKELLLLRKLSDNRGNIVTFDIICQTLWGDSYYGYENSLMVHVRRLREKIEEEPSKPKWLLTVRGLGYKLAKDKNTRE